MCSYKVGIRIVGDYYCQVNTQGQANAKLSSVLTKWKIKISRQTYTSCSGQDKGKKGKMQWSKMGYKKELEKTCNFRRGKTGKICITAKLQ